MAAGAICGGVQAGIEASLAGGDFSDVMLSAGLGAAFGAICPWGGVGALYGSVVGAGAAHIVNVATGKQTFDLATAWQWGGLAGGLVGDFAGAARAAIKFGSRRALQAGLIQVGPDLLGAGAGAIIGYQVEGTSIGALHGATLGMMTGGVVGGLARGLPGVRRALEPRPIPPRGLVAGAKAKVSMQDVWSGATGHASGWLRFWRDEAGETFQEFAPLVWNRPGTYMNLLRPAKTTIRNADNIKTNFFAWLDTTVHEGVHGVLGWVPGLTIWSRASYWRPFNLPVGAIFHFPEEVLAYTAGRVVSLRPHGLITVPIDALSSVHSLHGTSGVLTAAGFWGTVGIGGAAWYSYSD